MADSTKAETQRTALTNKGENLYTVFSEETLRMLCEQIANVQYGSVTIKIQDGKAVQIERNEKIRIV